MNGDKLRKKSMKRLALLLVMQMLILTAMPFAALAAEEAASSVGTVSLEAKSAVLMDAETGQIIYSIDADTPYPPASMSKMMTEYLVLEEIAKGNLKWDDEVVASRNAATTTPEGSRVALAEGEVHSVENLFIAMAVGSANDASIALGERIAGSEEEFVKLMNEKARELGLTNSRFINATGLGRDDLRPEYRPKSIDGETMMSAMDSAKLARALLLDHPEVLKYTSIPNYKFRERDKGELINFNWMLEANKSVTNFRQFAYDGLDGMKTGHTKEAGYTFTGTASRGDMRLVSVVMKTDSKEKRFFETRKLLDYGFSNFEKKTIVPAKLELEALNSVPIKKGVKKSVPLVTEAGMTVLAKKGTTQDKVTITAEVVDEEKLIAPIEKGTVLGMATVIYQDDENHTMEKQIPLIALEDVEKAGWFRLFFRAIRTFFANAFDSIKSSF